MTTLTSHSVVDQMAADLAQRRHATIQRNAAYVALARAILSDDTSEMPRQSVVEWHRMPIGMNAVAA